jgi:hypothetical protein
MSLEQVSSRKKKKNFSYLKHTDIFEFVFFLFIVRVLIMSSNNPQPTKPFVCFCFIYVSLEDLFYNKKFEFLFNISFVNRVNAIVTIHRVNIFIHHNIYVTFYFKTDVITLFFVVLVKKNRFLENNLQYLFILSYEYRC